jgi:hypothetical protein
MHPPLLLQAVALSLAVVGTQNAFRTNGRRTALLFPFDFVAEVFLGFQPVLPARGSLPGLESVRLLFL